MATYLIGIANKLLFEITDVKKISIEEEQDLVEIYNREKQLIFACNKMSMDFLAKWQEGDTIPESIKKIYDIPQEERIPQEEGPSDETTTPSTETPSEETPDKPSETPTEETSTPTVE